MDRILMQACHENDIRARIKARIKARTKARIKARIRARIKAASFYSQSLKANASSRRYLNVAKQRGDDPSKLGNLWTGHAGAF